ncbi:MAG TPA: ABC transporter substrate-binding protein [Puia sp.]|nr:ABC transporter substrate-binding protein [Puia sp.]
MDKTKKLKLGWLFPYSGIFRNLKNDLQQGWETALQKEKSALTIEAHSEFIQTGAQKDTEDALKKLLLYEQVDLVIGVVGTKVALNLLPILEKEQTPCLLMNLGADIPIREFSSDYLFYNSLHLWKSEWVMGRWAQKKYGGEPSINMSIYEGGYGLHESFKAGTSVSGAATVKLNIVKNFSSSPDTSPLIQYLNQQQPNHAHALLSGKEGEQFLRLFQEHDLIAKTGLTVNPFMVEDGLLPEIPAGLELYNALSWSTALDNPENHAFLHLYKESCGEAPNVFSLLAYESGLALAAATRDLPGKIGKHELTKALGQVRPVGPRGELSLSTRPLQTNVPVYIRKPMKTSLTGIPENQILETETGIEWNDPSLAVGQTYLTGWQNPYLCV